MGPPSNELAEEMTVGELLLILLPGHSKGFKDCLKDIRKGHPFSSLPSSTCFGMCQSHRGEGKDERMGQERIKVGEQIWRKAYLGFALWEQRLQLDLLPY